MRKFTKKEIEKISKSNRKCIPFDRPRLIVIQTYIGANHIGQLAVAVGMIHKNGRDDYYCVINSKHLRNFVNSGYYLYFENLSATAPSERDANRFVYGGMNVSDTKRQFKFSNVYNIIKNLYED